MTKFALDSNSRIFLTLFALLAGFIYAVVSRGGMLTGCILLSIGLSPHLPLTTNKLSVSFASGIAVSVYFRKKLFTPQFGEHLYPLFIIIVLAMAINLGYNA